LQDKHIVFGYGIALLHYDGNKEVNVQDMSGNVMLWVKCVVKLEILQLMLFTLGSRILGRFKVEIFMLI